jgi:Zn-dependent protease
MAMIAVIPLRYNLLIGANDPMIFLRGVVELVVKINLSLMLFNLIPVPPLDGSRILAWLLPRRLTYELDRLERYAGIMLIFVALFIARMPWFYVVRNFLFNFLRG